MITGHDAYRLFRDEFIALAPDKYPADYIDGQVWAGFWRCLSNGKAAILFTLKTYPSGLREVEGLAAVGELESITALVRVAEDWGRTLECAIASIESRPAWTKIMKQYGYEVSQVRIEKGL